MPKQIELKTSDGVGIVGDFYQTDEKESPAIILLHMMPSNKESWRDFAKKLNLAGFQCLAIDLRGHGESEGGPVGYRTFSNEQHKASIYDVEVAAQFFISKGVPPEKISLAGASIGANLALQFQSEHQEIKASVLLSPGLDYFGIDTEPMIKKLREDQSVFFSAGGAGDEYSTETAQKLSNLRQSLLGGKNARLKIFENAGHGTTMFNEERFFMDEIIDWLRQIYYD